MSQNNRVIILGRTCLKLKYNRHLIIAMCFIPYLYSLFYYLLIFPSLVIDIRKVLESADFTDSLYYLTHEISSSDKWASLPGCTFLPALT